MRSVNGWVGEGHIERFYINVPLNTRIYTDHRKLTKYMERIR